MSASSGAELRLDPGLFKPRSWFLPTPPPPVAQGYLRRPESSLAGSSMSTILGHPTGAPRAVPTQPPGSQQGEQPCLFLQIGPGRVG